MIDTHLAKCDEMMVLLSPSSVKSDWVLMEIGGARALGKRVVPILLHIDSNQLPNPISKHHAIDLNRIDVYFKQISDRLAEEAKPTRRKKTAKKETPASKKKTPTKKTTIRMSVGDKVRLPSTRPATVQTGDTYTSWDDYDDTFFGQTTTVAEVDKQRDLVRLDIDSDDWYAIAWLRKV